MMKESSFPKLLVWWLVVGYTNTVTPQLVTTSFHTELPILNGRMKLANSHTGGTDFNGNNIQRDASSFDSNRASDNSQSHSRGSSFSSSFSSGSDDDEDDGSSLQQWEQIPFRWNSARVHPDSIPNHQPAPQMVNSIVNHQPKPEVIVNQLEKLAQQMNNHHGQANPPSPAVRSADTKPVPGYSNPPSTKADESPYDRFSLSHSQSTPQSFPPSAYHPDSAQLTSKGIPLARAYQAKQEDQSPSNSHHNNRTPFLPDPVQRDNPSPSPSDTTFSDATPTDSFSSSASLDTYSSSFPNSSSSSLSSLSSSISSSISTRSSYRSSASSRSRSSSSSDSSAASLPPYSPYLSFHLIIITATLLSFTSLHC